MRQNDAQPSKLDELDRKIVGILQGNGRTSNREIARTLDVSEATIRNRVARLVDEGLINIVAVPTPKAVGMSMSAIIGVSVQMRSLDDIVETVVAYPEVRYLGLATGRHDIVIEAFFEDQENMLHFVTKKLGQLDGVENVETSVILKVSKFSYEWEIPIGR